ncbi:MAG: radical SAM protein [Candidatus Omnitrophica bacterium]|nr:radical SAM protein [Candidatus Omnitrophota bacterium]
MTAEKRYDMYVHWNLSLQCNFSCEYCIVNAAKEPAAAIDIPKVIRRLDELNKTLLISFSGGEPFIVPNFTELCRELTKKHYIRIDSNLSLVNPCKKFMNTIDPERVLEICFSPHVGERERLKIGLDELVSLVKEFQKNGFRMIGNYTAYPPLLGRMERDIKFFESHGIKVLPTFFWGRFNGKHYPVHWGRISYSRKDLELIERLNRNAKTHLRRTRNDPCLAGSSAFTITNNEVIMCDMIHTKLGDFFGEWRLFPKIIRCTEKYCPCPLNRAPAVTLFPDDYPAKEILKRELSAKTIYSLSESYKMIEGSYFRLLLNKMRSICWRLGLRRSMFPFLKILSLFLIDPASL